MKRYSDVLALIQESTDQYNEVKALYDGALRDKSQRKLQLKPAEGSYTKKPDLTGRFLYPRHKIESLGVFRHKWVRVRGREP